jgi:hypothetical protein
MSSPTSGLRASGAESNSLADGEEIPQNDNANIDPLSPFNYDSPGFADDSLGIDQESLLAINAAFTGEGAGTDRSS